MLRGVGTREGAALTIGGETRLGLSRMVETVRE